MTRPIPTQLADDALFCPDKLLLPDGMVAGWAVRVVGERFAGLGPRDDMVATHPGVPVVDLPDMLMMPGFIDAHSHLTQSFGKALAFGEPSEIFRRIWVPLEQYLDAELIALSTKLAALEAMRGGFTTVVDAGTRSSNDIGIMADALKEVGLRCVLGFICNDGPASDAQQRQRLLDAAREHIVRFQDDGMIHPSLAISIPEAGSDAMLQAVAHLAIDTQVMFQTHVNEHLAAIERSLIARGLRPLQHLHACNALGPSTLIAHATLLTPQELDLVARTGTSVAYNPVASLWKGNAIAQAELMITRGIPVGLGTDSTRYDAFRLMDAAESCQRAAFGLANGDFSCGAGRLWLEAATGKGAHAVGLDKVTGAIASGLAADFLLIDLAVPELCPSYDLEWELVRLASSSQITAVYVGGKMRLWRGWPLDWDAKALMTEVRERARAAVAAAPIHKIHAPARPAPR